MDKLTRESKQHEEIFESLTLFKKSLEALESQKISECCNDLNKFFEENIVEHFQFEEQEVFPAILKVGTIEEKHLIRELQQEHINVLDKYDRLKNSISESKPKQDKDQMGKLKDSNRELIELMLKHSHKEDNEFFPLLKKYQLDLE